MLLSDFDFDLPEKFIAQNPVSPRDHSRLMLLNRKAKSIEHKHFYDIADYLNEGDVLVVNTSKVIPARISFELDGRSCEIFLLNKVKDGIYECMVKPGKKFFTGVKMKIKDNVLAEVLDVLNDGTRVIKFTDSSNEFCNDEAILSCGVTPLPPYIKHSTASLEDYQTVYANEKGSVAAPTAGLHFTPELLEKLRKKGVRIVEVLLHVNRGTFAPVKTKNILDHQMHSEFYSLSEEAAEALNKAQGKIVAVGTTSVRVLESSYKNGFTAQNGETDIFIYPGYKWKAVDMLITNFHLPKSTLLMLVSSFATKDFVMQAYEDAKKNNYRFFSFGDAMLII